MILSWTPPLGDTLLENQLLYEVGLCANLSSWIISGCVHHGFALVRPPGHHAGVGQATGSSTNIVSS
jgi:acetoin utilization deacetylase AcuC-like enzyme